MVTFGKMCIESSLLSRMIITGARQGGCAPVKRLHYAEIRRAGNAGSTVAHVRVRVCQRAL